MGKNFAVGGEKQGGDVKFCTNNLRCCMSGMEKKLLINVVWLMYTSCKDVNTGIQRKISVTILTTVARTK